MLTTRTWFASLGQRAASWLGPKPLFAETEPAEKFSGGGPSGWSPISFAQITGTGTDLAFDKPPKTGVVGQDIALVVRATSDGGNALPGVTITINLANNSGVPAGAVILNDPATGVTGPDGSVTIKVQVNKPGGYTFIASGELLGGASTNTAVTTSVTNVKSK